MESIQDLNGAQITSYLVRHAFEVICPEHVLEKEDAHQDKKSKVDSEEGEYYFCRPFHNDASVGERYLSASPKAPEIFELIRAEKEALKRHGWALLAFLLEKCDHEMSRNYITDYVLTKMSKEMQELLTINEDSLYYALTVLLECIKSSPIEKIKDFISSFGFYNMLGKQKPAKSDSSVYPVTKFYKDMLDNNLIDDIGLRNHISVNDVSPKYYSDMVHSNGKKKLCLLLLVGLKGVSFLDKSNLVRLILDHVKHDTILNSICTLRLLIVIILQVWSAQCSRLSLTLSNSTWSDIPESLMTSIVSSLSFIISQTTQDSTMDTEKVVAMNRIVFSVCSEFVEHMEKICDAQTLASALMRFDITNISMADVILNILRSRSQLGPLYMSKLKCSYNGSMEYMVIMKFLLKWFEHINEKGVNPSECLSNIPPCLSQSFFNYGLLSSDRWLRQGTLRMLSAFLRFVTTTRSMITEGSKDKPVADAITQHVSSIIPDFKTLLNVKTSHKDIKSPDEVMINIKNEKRSMISNELGEVLNCDRGDVILDIKHSDLILTDWLRCLHMYSMLIGVSEGRSLYDPLKLLREDGILSEVSESHPDLDIALVDCIFFLGVGEVYSGVSFTKVQRGCFQYIMNKYMDFKVGKARERLEGNSQKDHISHCETYIKHIMEKSGFFGSISEPWLVNMLSYEDLGMFTFLFDHCMGNSLEILLGKISDTKQNNTHQSFKCLNCPKSGGLEGPIILRLTLTFLLHLCSDSSDDFECEVCKAKQSNLITLFNKGNPGNLNSGIQYILRVCNLLDGTYMKNNIRRVVKAIAPKYILEKKGGSEYATENALNNSKEDQSNSIDVIITDKYLVGCLGIVDSIGGYDQDVEYLKELTRILIDTLVLRTSQSEVIGTVLKEKWKGKGNADIINKCIALDTHSLYTHIFTSVLKLLEAPVDFPINRELLRDIKFTEDIIWAQHYYLSHAIGIIESDMKDTADRFLVFMSNVYKEMDTMNPSERCVAALTISKMCSLMPANVMLECAPGMIANTLQTIKLPLQCNGCTDVLNCEFGFTMYLFDISSCLVSYFRNPQLAADMLQSKLIMDITDDICKMNRDQYYIGDAIECHMFLSFVTFLRSLVHHIASNGVDDTEVDWEAMYQLLEKVSSCYHCSYSDSDVMMKEIILGIVNTVSILIRDTKSAVLRIPQFKDFSCISNPENEITIRESNSELENAPVKNIHSHGKSNGWLTMNSGFAMASENSNWLSLNNKRIAMTMLDFPIKKQGTNVCLKNTFRNLAILYPPLETKSPKKSDEIFGSIIRLNKILKSQNRYIQHLLVGDPYYYDIEYLIPFFTGRLCVMLYHQLFLYKKEFEATFQDLGFNGRIVAEKMHNRFIKSFSMDEATEAAKRIYNQVNSMSFEYDLGDSFSIQAVEQVIKNGVVEICSLGLLSKTVRKDSIKALGLVMKLLHNMLDATMVRSMVPGNIGPFRLRRIGLFGIYQVHSVLLWLQRCQLYASKGDPSIHILFGVSILHKLIKVDDPLYKKGNKYLLSRFEPRLNDIPLFFECFCVHDFDERPAYLGFITQLLVSAANIVEDYNVLFSRRIFQQLMSYAVVQEAPLENKIQVAAFLQRCALAHENVLDELLAIGTVMWVSNMAKNVLDTDFKEAKDVVLATLLLCTMTKLLRGMAMPLCSRFAAMLLSFGDHTSLSVSDDPTASEEATETKKAGIAYILSILRDMASTADSLERLATTWHHLLSYIPGYLLTPIRKEGYRVYMLINEEILGNIMKVVNMEGNENRDLIYKPIWKSLEMAERAVKMASEFLKNEGNIDN